MIYDDRGTFLILQGQPQDYGETSRFISQWLTSATGQNCSIRFFYYMFGSNTGSLTTYVRYSDPSIKSSSKPHILSGYRGQQWLRDNYLYSDHRPFQFVIEGKVGNGPQNDLAIDDISFSEACIPFGQNPTTTAPKTTATHTITHLTSHQTTITNAISKGTTSSTSIRSTLPTNQFTHSTTVTNSQSKGTTSSTVMSTAMNTSKKPKGSTTKQSVPTTTSYTSSTKSSLHRSKEQKSGSNCE